MAGNPDAFDYKRLLTRPLKRQKFVTDLADAANEVLGREVEERRRRLERSKDSASARKGQILSWLTYLPDADRPAYFEDDGSVVPLTPGDQIEKGRVLRIVNNVGILGETAATDYLELEFVYNTRRARWLMPFNAPQERKLMISNTYALGFDFFNTTLSDEDYQRLYESLNMFWPENGRDKSFVDFIGYIKNIKLDMLALWSKDNGTDDITVLEPIDDDTLKAVHGGPWYLTSHVALVYDFEKQSDQYIINLSELEQLFYLFAPIMLVLERVQGTLNIETPVLGINAVSLANFDYGIYEPDTDFITEIVGINAVSLQCFDYGIIDMISGETNNNAYGPIDLSSSRDQQFYAPALIASGV